MRRPGRLRPLREPGSHPAGRRPAPGRIADLAGKCALVFTSFLLVGGVGEIVLRRLPQAGGVGASGRIRFNPYQPDGLLGYSLRPGARTVHEEREFAVQVAVNSLGLRGPEQAARKPPGVRRILVLGDSFAFGFGVEEKETFARALERRLRESRPATEVLNAGVPGWSADHHLVYLRERGFALEPDLVLLAACDNDPTDLAWNRLSLDAEGLPVRVETTRRMIDPRGRMRYVNEGRVALPRATLPFQQTLEDHSLLYHWLRFRWTRLRERLGGEPPPPVPPAWAEASSPPPLAELPPREIQAALAGSPRFRLRYHRALVAAIETEARRRGAGFFELLAAPIGASEDPATDSGALRAECLGRPERCLVGTDSLPPGAGRSEYGFQHDPHWNARGHDRVADTLARRLEG
jgi:hypothetical protein